MPSSPMLMKELFAPEAQPPIADVAEEIAQGVVQQIEWCVWSDITNRERGALEPADPDKAPASVLVQAIPVKLR